MWKRVHASAPFLDYTLGPKPPAAEPHTPTHPPAPHPAPHRHRHFPEDLCSSDGTIIEIPHGLGEKNYKRILSGKPPCAEALEDDGKLRTDDVVDDDLDDEASFDLAAALGDVLDEGGFDDEGDPAAAGHLPHPTIFTDPIPPDHV